MTDAAGTTAAESAMSAADTGVAAAEDLPPFDVCGPLPTGTTLLEASAGTGKTWTIGALVARYVAEGEATLDQLLVVTFGRAASQELRERVRDQLVAAERALAGVLAGAEPPGSDLLRLLCRGDAGALHSRHRRLREALGSFDAATIATTHQFCQLVLRSLGVAGDTDGNATLVEDLDDLLGEVVDDLYLRGLSHRDQPPPFSRAEAMALARAAATDPQARLEPRTAEPGSIAAIRLSFATAVRSELDRRKRRLGVLSYDDLLSQLADALADAEAPARRRMRQRWRIVLVDEFQDTDPVQWQVLDRAFTGHATMVLIGDPKQAIYAFRGGDVTTYLQAASTATTKQTLGTNWRADEELLGHLQATLGAARLGDPRIVVRDVRAAHSGHRLAGAGPPLRLRVISRELLGRSPRSRLPVKDIRAHLYTDVARDIDRLLTGAATFDKRRLRPRDVAVLAYRNADLQAIQEALAEHGVPAVVAGSGSVFATPAARQWLTLLEALERPSHAERVRSAALTCFVGHSAAELDAGGDALTDSLGERMREWAELFASRGVAAVLEAATEGGLPARVLSRVDGERLLTDIRHIGQSLHEVVLEQHLGLVALLTWTRHQMADDKAEVAEDRTRRLDSDAAAVQLVTIHSSKGLEYPVVYLPTLWDRFARKPDFPLFHSVDPADEGRRCLDVGGAEGPRWQHHLNLATAEEDGESLRLLYVAMTRAQSQVVTWWAPAASNTPGSALHRLLFGRRPGDADVPISTALPAEADVPPVLDAWQVAGGPHWEQARWAEPGGAGLPADRRPLSVRRFDRVVDTAWRRTSYTGLSTAATTAAAPPAVGSEPEVQPRDDEPELPAVVLEALRPMDELEEDLAREVVSPMTSLPVGATFGSLVHAVLEHADPTAGDLRAELLAQIAEQRVRWPVELDPDVLADAMLRVYDSPLGPLADGRTLREIGAARLPELGFELPLAGGDTRDYPADQVRLGDLAPLLRKHLPAGDPLLPYARALADPVLGGQPLHGYLTGSVDAVLRVGDGAAARYLVVDYKTNWLGRFPRADHPLTAYDYRPHALRTAMGNSDYPLQAVLYAVVLHRYLRWRQPGYDPSSHLGGVLYLYLRGMCGPSTPSVAGEPCGVFSWRPPVALVEGLSALLDGERPQQRRLGGRP